MRLSIKNPEANRLARWIADSTGETLTAAVVQALRERYARLEAREGKASVEEILAIAGRVSALIKGPYVDHGELLYDENGVPKSNA
jgi:antitoxin VapB